MPLLVVNVAAWCGFRQLARMRVRVGGTVVWLLIIVAVGWFVVYYPVLSAVPMSNERMMRMMWFRSWI